MFWRIIPDDMGIPLRRLLGLSGRGDALFDAGAHPMRTMPYHDSRKVRLVLLRRECGLLFFLDDLQAFDLLEGEAHDAAVLALVLEVDCLIVVVDEDLRRHPAAVVEALSPLWDVFVLYPLGLLAHPFAPFLASVCLPRRGSIYS